MERAYDAGVCWFDVAPSYGDGQAETIFGRFLAGKRSEVVLCTKVGKLPGRAGLGARMLKLVAQRVLRVAPQLRGLMIRHRAPTERVDLTGEFIECSIEKSLRRMATDYVDVLALHEPTLAEVERDDVLRALDDVVSAGHARCVGVAGELEVALRAIALSERIRVLQVANNYFTPNIERARKKLPGEPGIGFVAHSVYGHTGPLDRFTGLLGQESTGRALLENEGYCGTSREIAAAFLLDFALASNRGGIVLLSMYEPKHLRANLERLDAAVGTEAVLELRDRLISARNK